MPRAVTESIKPAPGDVSPNPEHAYVLNLYFDQSGGLHLATRFVIVRSDGRDGGEQVIDKTVAELVADGTLTQAQADALEQRTRGLLTKLASAAGF